MHRPGKREPDVSTNHKFCVFGTHAAGTLDGGGELVELVPGDFQLLPRSEDCYYFPDAEGFFLKCLVDSSCWVRAIDLQITGRRVDVKARAFIGQPACWGLTLAGGDPKVQVHSSFIHRNGVVCRAGRAQSRPRYDLTFTDS